MQLMTSAEYLSSWDGLDRTGIDMPKAIVEDDIKGRLIASHMNIPYSCVKTEYGELARLPVLLWDRLDMF